MGKRSIKLIRVLILISIIPFFLQDVSDSNIGESKIGESKPWEAGKKRKKAEK